MKNAFVQVLCLLLILQTGYTQMASDRSGSITNNGTAIATVTKYGGSANVIPKFWVVNTANDSVLHVRIKREFSSEWLQFDFTKTSKMIEVTSGEVIKGLNFRKNIASFLLKNNLITLDGQICDTAFERFAGSHTENLSEKFHKLNEMNYKLQATRFDYFAEDGRLVVNSKIVGYAFAPANQGILIKDIVVYDVNSKVLAKGERGMFGAITMKTSDGKTLNLNVNGGNTMNNSDKITFFSHLLKELCIQGVYPF